MSFGDSKLSGIYNRLSGVSGSGFGFGLETPGPGTDTPLHKQSILSCISDVDPTPVSLPDHGIDATKAGYISHVPAAQAKTSASIDLNRQTMAACTVDIRRVQAEVAAMSKAMGYDASAVFKGRPTTPTAVDLIGSAAVEGMTGKGTLVTALQGLDKFSTLKDMLADGKTSPEDAQAHIAEALVACTEAKPESTGLIQNANATPHFETRTDYKALFANHGVEVLDQIMSTDPDNPATLSPELAALDATIKAGKEQLAELDGMETKAETDPVNALGASLIELPANLVQKIAPEGFATAALDAAAHEEIKRAAIAENKVQPPVAARGVAGPGGIGSSGGGITDNA